MIETRLRDVVVKVNVWTQTSIVSASRTVHYMLMLESQNFDCSQTLWAEFEIYQRYLQLIPILPFGSQQLWVYEDYREQSKSKETWHI